MGCCASEGTGLQNDRLNDLGKLEKGKDVAMIGAPRDNDAAGRRKKYAGNKSLVLGYWKMRGLAHPIRYLLEYTEHPYENVMYEQGDPPNFSVESWTSVKNTLGLDFPSIPYLIDPNTDAKLTDPYAIMLYIATSYAPELLGQTHEQTAEIDMLYGQLKDVKTAITGPCYVGADRKTLSVTAKEKMKPIVAYLGKKDFLFGNNLSFLDFYMLEQCEFVQWLTEEEFLSENKAAARFVKRMKNLKQIKRYIKSDRFLAKPFNNKVAKINNL